MFAEINNLGPGQNLFIFITIITAIFLLIIVFISSRRREGFKASDGSVFKSKESCEVHENLIKKISPLYQEQKYSKPILGFDENFLEALTNQGFKNKTMLIRYSKELKKLADFINE